MISLYISAESGRRTEKNIFTKYIKGKCEHPVSAGGPLKLCNHFGAKWQSIRAAQINNVFDLSGCVHKWQKTMDFIL